MVLYVAISLKMYFILWNLEKFIFIDYISVEMFL